MSEMRNGARAIFDALTLLRPFDIDLPKVRYGSNGDGGYVFADAIRPSQPILSFGVADNCDLEYDFAERGHKVFLFDPSVEGTPKSHPNFTFRKIGVADRDSVDGGFQSLATCLDKSDLLGRTDIILKIDVEGAEWSTFASIDPEILLSFEQIALEIHWLDRLAMPDFRDTFGRAMTNVNRNFINFHVHANNCCPIAVVGSKYFSRNAHATGGFPVACVLELSFVRKDLVNHRPSQTYYPSALDYPNHPFYPDHILSFYPFLPMGAGAEEHLRLISELSDLKLRGSGHENSF